MTLQRFITRTTLLVQEQDAAINEAAFGSVSSRKTRAALGMEAAAAPLMRHHNASDDWDLVRPSCQPDGAGGLKFGKKLRC